MGPHSYQRPISQAKLDQIINGLVNLEMIKDIKGLMDFLLRSLCLELRVLSPIASSKIKSKECLQEYLMLGEKKFIR